MSWDDVGGNPAPGEPAQIRTVANQFGDLAASTRYARTQISALQRGELQGCWAGEAADAFAAELEILPADLGKLERSLDHASSAVRRWANTVDQKQDEAEAELRTYNRAAAERRVAVGDRDRERVAVARDAIADPLAGLGDLLSGNERLAPYDRRVDDATSQVRRAESHIDQIREDVYATARTVANLLDEASRLGIQNKDFFQKLGDFLESLGEVLKAVLKFLDELVDLLAPWIGMALFILSFVNPAFALAAMAFAALDFGLTASRMALGDEDVTLKDLLDDGIDLGLALVGAKGAGAGIKGLQSAKAAAQSSRLVKVVDGTMDVIGGAKALGDFGLNIANIGDSGPGSVFDFVADVSDGADVGSSDYWTPDGDNDYFDGITDAAQDVDWAIEDATDSFADFIDSSDGGSVVPPGDGGGVVPPGDGGGGGVVPPGDGGGGGVVPPGDGGGVVPPGDGGGGGVVPPGDGGGGGVVPPGDGGGVVPPGDGGGVVPPGDGGGLVPPGDGGGNVVPGTTPGNGGTTPAGDGGSVLSGTPDLAPAPAMAPAAQAIPVTGLGLPSADLAPIAVNTIGGVAPTAGSNAPLLAGAAALGVAAAAAGGKRMIDKSQAEREDNGDEGGTAEDDSEADTTEGVDNV